MVSIDNRSELVEHRRMLHVVLLAGGEGQRLLPETSVLPKPLLPLHGEPLLRHILQRLQQQGVSRVSLCVRYMAEIFAYYVERCAFPGLRVDLIREEVALGTAAPLRLLHELPEDFLVLNADTVVEVDIHDFFSRHVNAEAILTLGVRAEAIRIPFGVVDFESSTGTVRSFLEKPERRYFANTGLYAMNRRALGYLPSSGPYGMDDLIRCLLSASQRVCAQEVPNWIDFGERRAFQRAVGGDSGDVD